MTWREDYGVFKSGKTLSRRGDHCKGQFAVTDGRGYVGPMFLIEKKEKGFNPRSKDWLFMMIKPSGEVVGITNGVGCF